MDLPTLAKTTETLSHTAGKLEDKLKTFLNRRQRKEHYMGKIQLPFLYALVQNVVKIPQVCFMRTSWSGMQLDSLGLRQGPVLISCGKVMKSFYQTAPESIIYLRFQH